MGSTQSTDSTKPNRPYPISFHSFEGNKVYGNKFSKQPVFAYPNAENSFNNNKITNNSFGAKDNGDFNNFVFPKSFSEFD